MEELEEFGCAVQETCAATIIARAAVSTEVECSGTSSKQPCADVSPIRNANTRQLTERVNEMAIHQEPDDIPPDGRKIDFVILGTDRNTYVEVKTVQAYRIGMSWRQPSRARAPKPLQIQNLAALVVRGT